MKFAVGDKVTITDRTKYWNGVPAVVHEVDAEESTFPYSLRLLAETPNGNYKAGEIVEAFATQELTATEDIVAFDVAEAVRLLQKHGLAFRIYTREDVDKMLDLYAEDLNDPVDTRTFREELVGFIMGGQDWTSLSQKGYDDESALWNLVSGARNDHPEWFVG